MRVIIKDNKEEVAQWASQYVAYKLNQTLKKGNDKFVLGLPTGSTPLDMYKNLIQLYENGRISFEKVITFNMDEYIGLPPTHPQSYHYFMYENLFNHIDIKQQNIHILDGMTTDYEKECANYEKSIENAGGIDLFIGGVGPDGHIAFNEPFSSLSSRTRVKTLAQSTIIANSRFFDNDVKKVPTKALTVGVATIMSADEVMILATGKGKAQALQQAIEGSISHTCTLSSLQLHEHGIIVCDKEAASSLKKETIEYFLDVEKGNY